MAIFAYDLDFWAIRKTSNYNGFAKIAQIAQNFSLYIRGNHALYIHMYIPYVHVYIYRIGKKFWAIWANSANVVITRFFGAQNSKKSWTIWANCPKLLGNDPQEMNMEALKEFMRNGKITVSMQSLSIALSDPSFCGLYFAFDTYTKKVAVKRYSPEITEYGHLVDIDWMPIDWNPACGGFYDKRYRRVIMTAMLTLLEKRGFAYIPRGRAESVVKMIARKTQIDLSTVMRRYDIYDYMEDLARAVRRA